jgi:uncharacterized membrane protein YgcG
MDLGVILGIVGALVAIIIVAVVLVLIAIQSSKNRGRQYRRDGVRSANDGYLYNYTDAASGSGSNSAVGTPYSSGGSTGSWDSGSSSSSSSSSSGSSDSGGSTGNY